MKAAPISFAAALALASCGSEGLSVPSIFSGLSPQTYTWYPERSASGPVLVFVSLPRQEAVVYRTHVGGTVIISNSRKLPTMDLSEGPGGGASGSGSWSGLSKSAATSVVVSTRDRQVVVYQNGRRAATAPVEVHGSLQHLEGEEASLYAGDGRWHTVEGGESVEDLAGELRFPDDVRRKLHDISHPGTTMVITSEPVGTRGGTSRGVLGGEQPPFSPPPVRSPALSAVLTPTTSPNPPSTP